MSSFTLNEGATPADLPSAGKRKFFTKAGGGLFEIDSAGVEAPIGAGGGGGSFTQFLVGKNGTEPYSAIQTAIDAARTEYESSSVPQVVLVLPGTYTEDLTFKTGVALAGAVSPAQAFVTPGGAFEGARELCATVVGNHVFAFDVSEKVLVTLENLVLVEGDAAEDVVVYSGVAPGGTVVLRRCVLAHSGASTGELLSVVASSASEPDYIVLDRCELSANIANDFVSFAGDNLLVRMIDATVYNAQGAGHGLTLSNPGGVGLTGISVTQSSILGRFSVGANTGAIVHGGSVLSDGASAFTVAADGFLQMDELSVSTDGDLYAVAGAGEVEMSGCVIRASRPVDPDLTVVAREPSPVRAYIEDTPPGAGPHELGPLVVLVQVDTTGAAPTVVLPDPSTRGGSLVVVYDATGNAAASNITISSAEGTVIGTDTLNTNRGRALLVSTSNDWLRLE